MRSPQGQGTDTGPRGGPTRWRPWEAPARAWICGDSWCTQRETFEATAAHSSEESLRCFPDVADAEVVEPQPREGVVEVGEEGRAPQPLQGRLGRAPEVLRVPGGGLLDGCRVLSLAGHKLPEEADPTSAGEPATSLAVDFCGEGPGEGELEVEAGRPEGDRDFPIQRSGELDALARLREAAALRVAGAAALPALRPALRPARRSS
eukprot:CAMPEP_0168415112 /NCGR_PEP_ID=MMETSP0228-20121227/30068_1 /TAXON_ID=133427 /ORGANISM="Protoceratium reticulatum, Strain CCCM 535 (=CCMP 1889)" /LENGTH=205 /DNA_ID=CAMNT_0008428919 /DNA_START=129 /DNA_END=744 /DNA_ORIENTATION=+